jgi:hypothetical protein
MPNVIAPNPDMGGASKIVSIVAKFDIQKSAERMRPKVAKFKALTAEIVRELYFVKRYLKDQRGQRKDPGADDYIAYTWRNYCDDIGLSRQLANSWVRRFTPKELSPDGEDCLLSAEEARELAPPEPSFTDREMERRIAQVMATGERPDGWTKAEEKILNQRLSDKKFKEISDIWMGGKFGREPSRDFFAEVKNITRGAKRFRLKTDAQTGAQVAMFKAIHDYFSLFPDMETLMSAAVNLTDKIHSAANYFAELHAAGGEEAAP